MFLDRPKGGAETSSFVPSIHHRAAPSAVSQTKLNEVIMSKLASYLNEQDGASAAEYALILAIVGAAIAAAAIFLGSTIANAINSAATCISSNGGTC